MEFPIATQGRLVRQEPNAFWEWNLAGSTLSTVAGKVGAAGRKTAKTFPDVATAMRDLTSKHYKKLQEGFCFLGTPADRPALFQAWLTSEYTGSLSLDFDVERQLLAAARHAGGGRQQCGVLIINATTGATHHSVALKEFDVSRLRFFGTNLLMQVDDRVLQLDPQSGATKTLARGGMFPFLRFDFQAGRLLCSTAGKLGPTVQVIDLATGRTLLEIDAHEQRRVSDQGAHHAGALSSSGKLAAICRRPGEIEVYEIESGKRRLIRGKFPYAARLQFHPSDKWLAFAEEYGDWRFRLWRVDTLEEDTGFDSLEYRYPNGMVKPQRECFDFAFSPDGKLLALRDGDWIRVHDFVTQKLRTRIRQFHVVKAGGTGGLRLRYCSAGHLVTRTDRGVLTVYRDELLI